jgi:predicted transporter
VNAKIPAVEMTTEQIASLPFAIAIDGPRKRPHRGTLVLVLGIVGLFFWIPGVVAWAIGKSDLQAMDKGEMDPDGRDITAIGRNLGMASTLLLAGVFAVAFSVLLLRQIAALGPIEVILIVLLGVVAYVFVRLLMRKA